MQIPISCPDDETNSAIQAAGAFANPDWYSEAENAVVVLIRCGRPFTTDNVWKLMRHTGLTTPEPRAMGSVIQGFAKDGRIRSTGRYVESTRPECHHRPLRVWEIVK